MSTAVAPSDEHAGHEHDDIGGGHGATSLDGVLRRPEASGGHRTLGRSRACGFAQVAAMPTTGSLRRMPPVEPKKLASP